MGVDVIVLLSGGQDSTTCLFWALREYYNERAVRPVALSIYYRQRHADRELGAAAQIAELARVDSYQAEIQTPARSALLGHAVDYGALPDTFVPGRNAQMIDLAAALGYSLGHDPIRVVVGCSAVDFSGYPDCRPAFLAAHAHSLSLALDRQVQVIAPLVDRSKAQTVKLARELGPSCWVALARSWTCYRGGERPCGECAACVLRAKGFAEAGANDPAQDPALQ